MLLNRRAAILAGAAVMASAPAATAAAAIENVQPHSKLREWWPVLKTASAADPNPVSTIKRLAHSHFGGLPCVMEHKGRRVVLRDILSAEDGDFLQQFESGGITYAVADIDIRIDEYLHPHTVYVWDMTQDLT